MSSTTACFWPACPKNQFATRNKCYNVIKAGKLAMHNQKWLPVTGKELPNSINPQCSENENVTDFIHEYVQAIWHVKTIKNNVNSDQCKCNWNKNVFSKKRSIVIVDHLKANRSLYCLWQIFSLFFLLYCNHQQYDPILLLSFKFKCFMASSWTISRN